MNRRTAIQLSLAGVSLLRSFARGENVQRPPRTLLGTRYRRRTRLDLDWRFFLGDPAGAESSEFDDRFWKLIDTPHDWSVEGSFHPENPSGNLGGFAVAGVGWYRKFFATPDFDNKSVSIDFDGVHETADVWINGKSLGHNPYGYLGFQFELTPHLLRSERNLIAVRADNSRIPGGRWYTGSGIYRHVWLTTTGNVRIVPWGTQVRTEISSTAARVIVNTSVKNGSNSAVECRLETQILGPADERVAETTSTQQISSGSDVTFVQEFDVPSPALWSPDQPALYRVYSVVHSNQSPTDDYVTPFGIRSAQFDPERGFLLNGSSLKLKGLCLHQDAGCLGVAVPDRSIERRLQILKGIGCNAIRVAHNPASPELLDACDRMGILVFAEMFDKWATGYGKEFELPGFADWWEEILVRALHRDRNHPSIILWSVGNEAGVPGEESHDQMLGRLVEVVHREDPTRPATCALIPQAEIPVEDIVASVVRSSRLMDVLSLNYQEQWYELYRQERADIAIVGAESYPYLRGVPFGFETANNWYDVVRHDWVAGQFVWVGFDYLGESAGWPSKGWPNGLIDSCGFVKARGSFHQSVWRNEPYVKMIVQVPDADVDEGVPAWRWPKSVAHWTFPDSADVVFAVETPSNCETVELIVNGRSLGEQRPSEHLNSTIVWYVRYSRGALEAVGRNKGVEVARDVLFSAGPTQTMRIRPDKLILVADRQDLCHIEVNLLDANGVLVPNDDRQIQFVVLGPARLIGLDNGDLRSSESYKGDRRTTREGKCLAIIQSTTDIGIVRVIMSSEGLQTLLLPLEVIPPPASE